MSGESKRNIRNPIGLWRWLLAFTLAYIVLVAAGLVIYGAGPYAARLLGNDALASSILLWGGSICSIAVPLIFLVCAALTCRITYRMMKNLHEIGSSQVEMSPAWAVGYYFVPFANLIMPVRGIGEIWRGTFWPDEQPRPPNGVIALWWTTFLLSLATNFIASSGPRSSGAFMLTMNFDADPMHMTPLAAASSALSGLAAIFLLNVFGRIARGQSKLIQTTVF